MEDPYSTAPLNPGRREFRLVELWPSAESESIKCGLRSYSMNEDYPAYVALSYAWGRKERYDEIELNGFQFPVGKNLWWFLQHMQIRNEYIPFWIDAICINQSNVMERNHQVQMMRHVYSNAQSISVWLGEADNSCYSDIAMEYLAARKSFKGGSFKFSKLWSEREAKGVLALCERNYWRRIWIVQEIMLAKEITIHCGSKNLSWHQFEQLANILRAVSDRGREKHTPCVSSILASPAIVIVEAKSGWDRNSQPLTMLLQLYHDHEATDIRDKVYALIGLAKDGLGIVVDYRRSPKDLLVEVLYHACTFWKSSTARESAVKKLVRFGKLVGEMLRVHCSEEEIKFHIAMASRETCKEEFEHPVNVSLAGIFDDPTTQSPLGKWLQYEQQMQAAGFVPARHYSIATSYVLPPNTSTPQPPRERVASNLVKCRPPFKPTWHGFLDTARDATIIVEAALQGRLGHISRRPYGRELAEMLTSGTVVVYEENASGIRRWTDAIPWSPSGVISNGLIYRQLVRALKPEVKKPFLNSTFGVNRKRKECVSSRIVKAGENVNNSEDEYNSKDEYGYTTLSLGKVYANFAQSLTPDQQRRYCGSLIDSYEFKEGGLMKKSISVEYLGTTHHVIAYYSLEDVVSGKLKRPFQDPKLADIQPRHELLTGWKVSLEDEESKEIPLIAGYS